MLSAFERMVAFRYLRARREEGLISVIALFSLVGIMLGVATLIVVLSVMNGVREEMIKSIIGLEGHITVRAPGRGIGDYDNLSQKITIMDGVDHAAPKVEGQVMLTHQGRAVGAMAVGFRGDDIRRKTLLASRISDGGIDRLVQGEGIIIGSRLMERMGIQTGDSVTLISPEGRATVAGVVPRIKAYKVVGSFTIGMFAYDNGMVLMPFAEAQTYFKLSAAAGDAVSAIEIITDNPDHAAAIAKRVGEALPGAHVHDWESGNYHLFQAVMVQRNVAFFIVMLIIVVAAFNIISSLIMLVREKERQVAILRTMGAARGSVLRIFFACGAAVGVIGSALGVALGLLIAFNTENIQAWLESLMGHKLFADELYFLSHLPARVEMQEVLAVVAMSLALSFLATIYPARKAAALDPAEALRYE